MNLLSAYASDRYASVKAKFDEDFAITNNIFFVALYFIVAFFDAAPAYPRYFKVGLITLAIINILWQCYFRFELMQKANKMCFNPKNCVCPAEIGFYQGIDIFVWLLKYLYTQVFFPDTFVMISLPVHTMLARMSDGFSPAVMHVPSSVGAPPPAAVTAATAVVELTRVFTPGGAAE